MKTVCLRLSSLFLFSIKKWEVNFVKGKIVDKVREKIFDELSAEWEKVIEGDHKLPIDELMTESDVEDMIVLDIGAGTGILIESGMRAKAKQWIAMDISSKMLDILSLKFAKLIDKGKLRILHADVHEIPIEDNQIDRVLCHNVFPHFENTDKALSEIHRVLKPDGLFAINHYSGREFINSIHSQSPNQVLNKDMIEEAKVLCEKIKKVGFEILIEIDETEKYRIIAKKKD